MLGIAFLVLAYGSLGALIARVAPAAGSSSAAENPWDFTLRAMVAGLAAWVAVSWVLAFGGWLTSATIVSCATLSLVASAGGWWRRRAAGTTSATSISGWSLAVIVPVVLWSVYVLFRSTIIPVGNHDALAYHLPRAVLFVIDHGYRVSRDLVDPRLTTWPANYELLLANVLAITGGDQGTIALSLIGYLGLAVVGASLTYRWWGSGPLPLLVFASVASIPLAILHSGAHKNDLLFALFAASAVYWLVPLALRGGLSNAGYGFVALGLAIGTKAHGSLLGGVSAPLLLVGIARYARRPARVGLLLGYGALTIALLGGGLLVLNVIHTGGLGLTIRTFQNADGPVYGDYKNLWRFPVVMLAAPFTSSTALWVPWSHQRYWWNEFDLYFGHYGAEVSVACVALLYVAWKQRRDGDASRERWLSVAILLVTFGSLLPLRTRPYGFFVQEARYYFALVPFILAFAAGGLAGFQHRRWFVGVATTAAGAWFCWNAYRMAANDGSQPLFYVWRAATAEALPREPPVQIIHRRVAYLVDELAGPRDPVAVDVGYDTWIYPEFGADFLRPVRFIPPASAGAAVIPADAKWVAIDRGQQEFAFTHPKLTDLRLSLFKQYFGNGTPAPENFYVLDQLLADPRFELVYRDEKSNQALFRRRVDGSAVVPK